jgi:hypothetical protein
MKFSSKCQQELPKPGPQVRQDYGLGTHAGEGDLSREINTPKNIVRQSSGAEQKSHKKGMVPPSRELRVT